MREGGTIRLPQERENNLERNLAMVVFAVALGASCVAQDGLVIRTNGRQAQPADAEKIYVSACLESNVSFASADQSGRR